MSGRSVRPLGLLVILVLTGLFAWGCTPGDGQTTTTVAAPGILPPPPGENGRGLLDTTIVPTESTPKEFTEAVAQGRPVVILFYIPGGTDDQKVLDSVRALQPSFAEYVFLLYDHKSAGAYGDLSMLLAVDYPPQLVLVDSTGTIREIWNGYVDEGTINQGLVNLGG